MVVPSFFCFRHAVFVIVVCKIVGGSFKSVMLYRVCKIDVEMFISQSQKTKMLKSTSAYCIVLFIFLIFCCLLITFKLITIFL